MPLKSGRVPIRPLSYENKEEAMNKELIIDYITGTVYVKKEDGKIINIATSEATMDAIKQYISENSTIILGSEITFNDQTVNSVEGELKSLHDTIKKKADNDHTHNYAGSSTAGGPAKTSNKVENTITINSYSDANKLNEAVVFDGSSMKSINVSSKGHTHETSEINGLDDALSGKSNTNHTHKYAGSDSIGGAANSAKKVANSLTIKTYGKTDTDAGGAESNLAASTTSFDGSQVSASIDVAAKNHTHKYAKSNTVNGDATQAEKVANSLTIKIFNKSDVDAGGTSSAVSTETFDGSNAKSIDVASKNHTHNYAASDTAGGAANSAKKVENALTITPYNTSIEKGSPIIFDGDEPKSIDVASKNHTHLYAGSNSAGGNAIQAEKVTNALTIKIFNKTDTDAGGENPAVSTETFDGSKIKSIDVASKNHTHNYAKSDTAGGAATSAKKVENALTITPYNSDSEAGVAVSFDGSNVKSIDVAAKTHKHKISDINELTATLQKYLDKTTGGSIQADIDMTNSSKIKINSKVALSEASDGDIVLGNSSVDTRINGSKLIIDPNMYGDILPSGEEGQVYFKLIE